MSMCHVSKYPQHSALALAALVDRDSRIVGYLRNGTSPLRLAVGAVDVRSKPTHAAPVVAEATSVFGK